MARKPAYLRRATGVREANELARGLLAVEAVLIERELEGRETPARTSTDQG